MVLDGHLQRQRIVEIEARPVPRVEADLGAVHIRHPRVVDSARSTVSSSHSSRTFSGRIAIRLRVNEPLPPPIRTRPGASLFVVAN